MLVHKEIGEARHLFIVVHLSPSPGASCADILVVELLGGCGWPRVRDALTVARAKVVNLADNSTTGIL